MKLSSLIISTLALLTVSVLAAPATELGDVATSELIARAAPQCRKGWTPCKEKKGGSLKSVCCNPTSVCVRNQGCVSCPLVTRGPLGAINGLGFAEGSTQEVKEDVTTPLACCSLCANNKRCSGFAWENGDFCNLALSDNCAPLTYQDKELDQTIFIVGGAPCTNMEATYGGPSYH